MTENAYCTACGAELAADAPQGLCPSCLMEIGLGSQAAGSGTSAATAEVFVPPSPADLARHFPDLEIVRFLGRGGMGMVYLARQKRLDRFVALKILQPQIARDEAFAERFAREARAMALLNHPHIVAVYDFGQTTPQSPVSENQPGAAWQADGPLYYFLMEYVDGSTLQEVLQAGKLSAPEALAVVPQICEALQYAHDNGVVHRDIKPANILVDKRGRVKIADFGLAKLVGRPLPDVSLTGTGQVMGTPQYMAPEQIEHPQAVDHRADIYSLGVVFYQMLTGELPMGRFAPPSQRVAVDVRLDEVVLRTLERQPELRYQQASQVKIEVETIASSPLAGNPPAIPPADARLPEAAIEQARIQIRGPAIGLLATGILNWTLVPLLILILLWLASRASIEAIPSFASGTATGVLLVILAVSSLMIFAAIKMKSLQGYGWAIAGSVLAMMISPGNIIGLPIGIWSLVVLSQPNVRAAFGRSRIDHHRSRMRDIVRSLLVGVIVALLLRQFVISVYWAVNDSASPEVPKGSYVLVYKLTSTYRPGDIVVYRQNDVFNLGRIGHTGRDENGLLPIERVNQPPRHIAPEAILGRVILNTRGFGLSSAASKHEPEPAPTAGSGPRIQRVVVSSNRAQIEGQGSRETQWILRIGDKSHLACVLSPFPFTASIQSEAHWGTLTVLVTDTTGKELLRSTHTKLGPMRDVAGQIVFHVGTPAPGPDGALLIAEFRPKSGEPTPIQVQLKKLDTHPVPSRDQVLVEDQAIALLAAIRDKDEAALQRLATDQLPAWHEALPQFALEIRERHLHKTGKPLRLWPAESLVEGEWAVVKCTGDRKSAV